MVEAARVNVPHAAFEVCDMRAYQPVDSRKFDAVVSIFSLFNMPTSAIREMAFKMAHWLKPGGLLVLGTIDFSDVPKADGYPEDPHDEWLNHHFMGNVIKDNVFGVGQWISLLRSADVALVDAQGSVFKTGDMVEPECFFIGRKGDKDALLGPYPSPHQVDGLHRHYTLAGIERYIVRNDGFLDTLLCTAQAVRRLSGCDLSIAETNVNDDGVYASVVATQALDASNDERILSELSSHLDRDAAKNNIVLVEPSPFNDTVHLLHEVATSFNCFRIHHGALLRRAVKYLGQLGFTQFQTHILDDEYIDFASSVDRVGDAAKLLRTAFIVKGANGDAIEAALRAQIDRYFENQEHLGGHGERIGFQRVALKASRYNVRSGPNIRNQSCESE
ncbi:MAG: hypothetical protein L6R40_006135 [Gallowayella cf. fulva]|nr:MAG: hypothetical protein L6R40_006135 [Xanthomendoza cf. fulva]